MGKRLPGAVLLLGGGGREHALAEALCRSPLVRRLVVAPGNPGMAEIAECRAGVTIDDPQAVVDLARSLDARLVVIGPEAPLAAGVADACRAEGIAVFGPSRAAARLETSKAFAKEIAEAAGAPTAAWRRFDRPADARAHVAGLEPPIVVKADGLAAGKGVTVATSVEEALAALQALDPQAPLIVEEFLAGEEASLFVLTDGRATVALPPARDHKRLLDGDRGPNTGGMGAFAPAPAMTDALVDRAMAEIVHPVLRAMAARGTPFSGLLYAGLMLTDRGPMLIEFNARFGDPETQVVLPLVDTDWAALFEAAALGELEAFLGRTPPARRPGASLVVTLAAPGYPGAPRLGGTIEGADAPTHPNVTLLHAGTEKTADGRLLAAGGRVLGVRAVAATIAEAQLLAYRTIETIGLDGGHYRRDIGCRAVGAEQDADASGEEEQAR